MHAAYSDRRETLGYKAEQLIAVAGSEYVLARKREPALDSPFTATPHPTTSNAWIIHDRRDRVVIRQRQTGGTNRDMAEAPKEAYVFGVALRDDAIAEYHRKNP